MKLLSILLLLISSSCFGQDVIRLDKDQVAPFSGNLIKVERLAEFYKSHKTLPLVEANLSLERQRIELYRDRLRKTESELTRAKTKAYLGTAGGFLLGVLITGFAAKAAIESVR